MKKYIIFLLVLTLAYSCASIRKSSKESIGMEVTANTNQDGSSFEKAVFINEKTETAGIGAEYVWLRQNYPGYKLVQQSLAFEKEKPYDIMDIKTADGEKKSIYFDISKFYGKF